jgi:radical SAM-linked protein
MERYAGEKVAVSFPSLRVGSLTPELMEEIKKVRKTGFTLAPEAGTDRLRQVINKGITEEDLLATTRAAFTLGWRLVKLYFMMGLPTETEEDLAAIVELAAQVKRTGKGTQGGADVNVAVSTFVPKPHTPFQWEPQLGIEETLRRQRLLREGLRTRKLRLKWHEAELSFLEGVFARGDRRLGAVLEKAVDLGCRFDGWRDHFDFGRWQQAFAVAGLDPAWYLRARSEDEILPWDHIDCGSPKEFFLRERRLALAGTYTPDCRSGACSGCGVCDFEELRMRLTTHGELALPPQPPAEPPGDEERYKVRLQLRKDGKARFVSHLEFMTVVHRAARRGGIGPLLRRLPPQPRISFPDALPLGWRATPRSSISNSTAWSAPEVVEALNALPEVSACSRQPRCTGKPGTSVSIKEVIYRVELPVDSPADLAGRLAAFFAAAEVPVTREKGTKSVELDLRRDVHDLELADGALWMTIAKGSPVRLAAHLLGLSPEAARELRIRKTAVVLG